MPLAPLPEATIAVGLVLPDNGPARQRLASDCGSPLVEMLRLLAAGKLLACRKQLTTQAGCRSCRTNLLDNVVFVVF